MPLKLLGATPTTVSGNPFSVIFWPTGSCPAPKCFALNASLTTTTG
jgi:hypothetical protein